MFVSFSVFFAISLIGRSFRLLYSRVGKTYSPISGQEVKKHSTEDIVNCMLSYPEGTRYTVLAPIRLREDRTLQQQLEIDLKPVSYTHLDVYKRQL